MIEKNRKNKGNGQGGLGTAIAALRDTGREIMFRVVSGICGNTSEKRFGNISTSMYIANNAFHF